MPFEKACIKDERYKTYFMSKNSNKDLFLLENSEFIRRNNVAKLSSEFTTLLSKMFAELPRDRITLDAILEDPFFKDCESQSHEAYTQEM
jgi:serine/threonine protein kinase